MELVDVLSPDSTDLISQKSSQKISQSMIASEEKQDGLGQGPRPKSSADLEPVIAPVVPTQFRPETEETAEEREQRMVHDVYETIAPHFSKTRYKVSPTEKQCLLLLDLT
jgi:hypothetical protein